MKTKSNNISKTESLLLANDSDDVPLSHYTHPNIYLEPESSKIRANISFKQSDLLRKYCDMGFVASIADNLFVLISPVKCYFKYGAKYATEKYESDQKTVKENFEKNIKYSKKLDKKVSHYSLLFSSISELYPDFCYNMQEKISKEKYELYFKQKQALKKASSQIFAQPITDLASETLLNYRDNIAKVIDSPEFSEACSIEDNFILSEINVFFNKLASQPQKMQTPFLRKKFKIGDQKLSTLDLAKKVADDRNSRLEKHSEIKKLYEKLNNASRIKLKSPSTIDDTLI